MGIISAKLVQGAKGTFNILKGGAKAAESTTNAVQIHNKFFTANIEKSVKGVIKNSK